jgi:Ca2+-binding RTX toxin-like protein
MVSMPVPQDAPGMVPKRANLRRHEAVADQNQHEQKDTTMPINGTSYSDTLDAADGVTLGNDIIYGYDGNDTIFGLAGDDMIYGQDDNDTIIGGFGADAIYGGYGTDTASYVDSHAGVVVSLASGTGSGGTAQGDTLDSIEYLTGSSYDDTLVGDDLHNALAGAEGADHLKGGGGDDSLYGQAGDDMLKGGGGEDILVGFTGVDTAAYNQSSAGVNVYLATGSGFGGDDEGDLLYDVENLIGYS